jgi:hypothetical protein
LDPVGEWRGDFRFANLSSLITNLVLGLYQNPDDKKAGKEPEFTDALEFMPNFDIKAEPAESPKKPPKKQSVEDQKWLFKQMALVSKRNKRITGKKERIRPRKRKS